MKERRISMNRVMKASMLVLCTFCAFMRTQAQHAHPRSDDAELGKQALIETDVNFSKLSAEKGVVEAFLSYMAEDATLLPGGSDPVTGRENIRRHLSRDSAGAVLTWEPLTAEIAASGDLGCTYGTYEYTSTDRDGNSKTSYGKYVTVWRKQKDGSWKFILDIGNQSPPPRKQ